jgi:hypothetical protein
MHFIELLHNIQIMTEARMQGHPIRLKEPRALFVEPVQDARKGLLELGLVYQFIPRYQRVGFFRPIFNPNAYNDLDPQAQLTREVNFYCVFTMAIV